MNRPLRSLRNALPRGTRWRSVTRLFGLVARELRGVPGRAREQWFRWRVSGVVPLSYPTWAHLQTVTEATVDRQRSVSRATVDPVVVHCVIRHRGDAGKLAATLGSLELQSWEHWRATVIGQATSAEMTDERVGIERRTEAELASPVRELGAVVGDRELGIFLEAGERLTPDACFEIADAAWRNPLVDLVSWDDDLVVRGGAPHDPRFRPEWSPEMLLSANYLGRSYAVRGRRLRDHVGDGSIGEDAAWWDLALALDLSADRVARVPRVLAHLGARPEPGPEDAATVVNTHLARRAMGAHATADGGSVHVVWDDGPWPHVTVIVPTRHNRPLVARCLDGVARSDYPSYDVVVIDNGDHQPENERWYNTSFPALDLRVQWWTSPFNYSAVNNAGARGARGEILVFLNDDTEVIDPTWLRELVGWARQPEIGVVGLQLLDANGDIQHGGVILGLDGFAEHLFRGMRPGATSLLGDTTWYRNVLAVTGACLAVRRELFDELGGFDERFLLCGSDVVLGLDAVMSGKRNVCSPRAEVRHLEAATRGQAVPTQDFFASYWRYQRWLRAGDPYYSPNLSLTRGAPRLADGNELPAEARVAQLLGRRLLDVPLTTDGAAESSFLAQHMLATDSDVHALEEAHAAHRGAAAPQSITWFLPDIQTPFYGGPNTALRIADHLVGKHGIESRFAFWAAPNEQFFRSALAAAFPKLADAPIYFYDTGKETLADIPHSDAAVATLWATAYSVAHFPNTLRRFYLIQDFEPTFYPAGTLYALADESYRLGLYGICNTAHMLDIYETRYDGIGMTFSPAIDPAIFHAEGRKPTRDAEETATVFVYGRPGHPRNCWELANTALAELKQRLGDRVRILTAGSWAQPDEMGSGIEHLGMLDYRATGALYRACDIGVALTVSEHPSYLPFELMACGVAVVALRSPSWPPLLRDGENCVLARRTADALSATIEQLVLDPVLERRVADQGRRDIAAGHASWDAALSGIHEFLSDPEARRAGAGIPL